MPLNDFVILQIALFDLEQLNKKFIKTNKNK